MATTKLKLSLAVLLTLGAATILVVRRDAQTRLQREIESLRQEVAQLRAGNESLSNRVVRAKGARVLHHLPVLPLQIAASKNDLAEDLTPSNVYARFKDKPPKLTAEQVESYLRASGRKASHLLAAYRTGGDAVLLKEAMEKYPADPQVAFEAIFSKDLSAEDQRQWLNALKASAPDNALVNYLSARQYLDAGQTELAVQDLNAASVKPQFRNYTLERWIDDEEAYRASGYSEVEAKYLATSELELPQLAPLKQLGLDLVNMAKV